MSAHEEALGLLADVLADRIADRMRPAEPPRECMSVPEVAAFLGCSKGKTYGLIRDEGLPTRRVGCEARVLRSELMAWLESRPRGVDGGAS